VGSLRLLKFPARDLKRALEQASVRAFLGPPRVLSAQCRRHLHNPLSTAECPKATVGGCSAAEYCGGVRTVPRMYRTVKAEDGTGQHWTAPQRPCTGTAAMQLLLMLATTRRIGGRRYAEAGYPSICRPTTCQRYTPTRTHTHTHTNKHTNTHIVDRCHEPSRRCFTLWPTGQPHCHGLRGGTSLSSLYRKQSRR